MAKKLNDDFQILKNSIFNPLNIAQTRYQDVIDENQKRNICIMELFTPKGKLIFRVSHIRNTNKYDVEMPDYRIKLSDKQREELYDMMQNRDKLLYIDRDFKSKKHRQDNQKYR